jgi:hypothetical protein
MNCCLSYGAVVPGINSSRPQCCCFILVAALKSARAHRARAAPRPSYASGRLACTEIAHSHYCDWSAVTHRPVN